jgi:hypothetical protein
VRRFLSEVQKRSYSSPVGCFRACFVKVKVGMILYFSVPETDVHYRFRNILWLRPLHADHAVDNGDEHRFDPPCRRASFGRKGAHHSGKPRQPTRCLD